MRQRKELSGKHDATSEAGKPVQTERPQNVEVGVALSRMGMPTAKKQTTKNRQGSPDLSPKKIHSPFETLVEHPELLTLGLLHSPPHPRPQGHLAQLKKLQPGTSWGERVLFAVGFSDIFDVHAQLRANI